MQRWRYWYLEVLVSWGIKMQIQYAPTYYTRPPSSYLLRVRRVERTGQIVVSRLDRRAEVESSRMVVSNLASLDGPLRHACGRTRRCHRVVWRNGLNNLYFNRWVINMWERRGFAIRTSAVDTYKALDSSDSGESYSACTCTTMASSDVDGSQNGSLGHCLSS